MASEAMAANGKSSQPWEADELYLPFKRTDEYGTMGMAPLPLHEKLRLALLAVVVVPIKLMGALACLLVYYAICRASLLLPSRISGKWLIPETGKLACRACLFCLGFVRVEWIRVEPSMQQEPEPAGVIVSNHCSWLDILVHMSRSFPAFVARDATKTMPLIGLISQLMGCIYVNRNIKDGVSTLVKNRIEAAAEGKMPHSRPLLLFPEGTTTNGEYLMPFKTGAFLAGQPVQPVILRYGKARVGLSWEMIPAPRHLFLVLCNLTHSVTCYELPVYVPSSEERRHPKLYASNVRKYMLEFAGLKDTQATYQDKMRIMQQIRAAYGLPVAHIKKAAEEEAAMSPVPSPAPSPQIKKAA